MANLYKLCPKILKENRLYWLQSPLYIEYDKNEKPKKWWYDDESFFKDRSAAKGTVKYVKGLGQLSEIDLKEIMFSKENQRLDKMTYSDEGMEQLCNLMGIDIEPRKEFVFNRIDFSKFSG